jgi:hypothetical protein
MLRFAIPVIFILIYETLSPVQFVGFTLALVGVLLARSAHTGINRTGLTSTRDKIAGKA